MSSPSPGWYPDPNSPVNLRFYDGDGWTRSVVPVPTDGQLTKEMIATGRKIMQTKASSKFEHASFTPSASEAPATGRRARTGASGLATSHSSSSASSAASAAGAAHARDAVPMTDAVEKASEQPTVEPAQQAPATPSTTVAAARRAADVKANVEESGTLPKGKETKKKDLSEDPASKTKSAETSDTAKQVEAPNWTKNQGGKNSAVNKDFSATEVEPEKPTAQKGAKQQKKIALIVGAIVVVAALLAGVYLVFIRDDSSGAGEPSEDYRSLGLKDEFGCKELAREVIELSQSSETELEVTAINDVEMVKDNRAKFTLPTTTGSYEVAFECQGTARYADGSTETLTYDISADKNSRFWTSYPQREK